MGHFVMAGNVVLSGTVPMMLIVMFSCDFGVGMAQLVPAIITFGDSSVDVGNNDYLATAFRADCAPYGRDFPNKVATGRFSNGKLATDITAETLGFKKPSPAYLSPEATGNNLLKGVNFASAGSGFDDKTAIASNVIPLTTQVEYFKEYQSKLAAVAGSKKAASIISGALYIVSFGNSDFLQNYYLNPILQKMYTPDEYSSYLIGIYSNLIEELYGLGARRIGVTSLPPLGCIPASITLFGYGSNTCVQRLNDVALGFNKKMHASTIKHSKQYPKLKIAVFDIYKPVLDLVHNPSKSGFAEARKGCCGSGLVETTVALCNTKSPGTCANATEYVFWDAGHPTEAANQVIADSLLFEGINLVL